MPESAPVAIRESDSLVRYLRAVNLVMISLLSAISKDYIFVLEIKHFAMSCTLCIEARYVPSLVMRRQFNSVSIIFYLIPEK